MKLELIAWTGGPIDGAALRARLESEGFSVWQWSDAPGADYTPHQHDHDESLWVVAGDITFGALGQDLLLRAGDRLMLPAGTVHTARAGVEGATYLIGEREQAVGC